MSRYIFVFDFWFYIKLHKSVCDVLIQNAVEKELNDIASSPKDKFAMLVNDFSELGSVVDVILNAVCYENGRIWSV